MGADSILGEVAVDLSDASPSSLTLRALGIRAPTLALDSAWIEGSGRPAGHALVLGAAAGPEALTAAARGRWDGRAWTGDLSALDLESGRAGPWALSDPAPLFASRDSISLGRTCWTAVREGDLCFEGAWAPGSDIRWSAAGGAIPLAFLEPALPDALSLDGTASLETAGRLAPGSAPRGTLRIEAESAALRYRIAGDEERRRGISELRLDAEADPEGMRGRGELRFSDGDRLALEAEADPGAGGRRSVRARLTADLRDRGLVEALTGNVVIETGGHLLVDLSAAGPLPRPAIDGSVRIAGASAVVPSLGIRVDPIAAEARADPARPGVWLLSAGAASGRGGVALDGSLRLPAGDPGWSLDARLAGREFEAYRTSLGRLVLSPDLGIRADARGIEVDGELGVPLGRIATASFPSAVAPAPDVRVAASAREPEDPAASFVWPPVRARVRVALGEEISVDAMGLAAELGGELTVVTEPGRAPIASGTLEIERGSYTAYGQRLTIDRGRLVYVQAPLDDPSLELRIVRESRGVTARMEVTGTVRRPRITLSSDPSLADDEILAYLLLGRPVSELS
ncbi:MAG TPA: translocation/assembly module TamB domain-containing protein, partial [Longimicrobiales bacterium]|nr:translocation/assembly module TamB domain-containing protein [Longimicrobiales bacterium]